MAEITVDINSSLNDAFKPLYNDKHRYQVCYGGGGSGKSQFIARKIIGRIITEAGHNIGIFRKVARTLKKSCFKLCCDIIDEWGLTHLFKINNSELILNFIPNGNNLWFIGLDDQAKLKSIEHMTSAWLEESDKMTEEDFTQVDLRVRGQLPNYKQICLSFNPVSDQSWLKGRFFDSEQHGKTITHHSTYRDNRFIDEEYKEMLGELMDRDEQMYRIYNLGEWGVLKGLIYDPPVMIPRSQYPESFDRELIGVDWGFNNPSAALHLGIKDQEIFVTELFYDSGYTTDMMIAEMPTWGIGRHMVNHTIEIICDAAEPDRIETVRQAGYNAMSAHKGQGSVQSGIDCVRTYKIYTCIENVNYNREKSLYRWREKDGKAMDEPLKEDDHAMDAERYAIWTALGERNPVARLW